MAEIIATFKVNTLNGNIKDTLLEIAENNEMDLISWGTI